MPFIKAMIKDSKHTWVEEFQVDSLETAEDEIKRVIQNFNDTLRPYEREREFVKIIDNEIDDNTVREYLQKMLIEINRENSNAFGNAKIKINYDKYKKKIKEFLLTETFNQAFYKKLYKFLISLPDEYVDEQIVEYCVEKSDS